MACDDAQDLRAGQCECVEIGENAGRMETSAVNSTAPIDVGGRHCGALVVQRGIWVKWRGGV